MKKLNNCVIISLKYFDSCVIMILGCINCYLYRGKGMYNKTPYGNLRIVQNWKELYYEILKLKFNNQGEIRNGKIFNT